MRLNSIKIMNFTFLKHYQKILNELKSLASPDEILGSIFGSIDGDIYNKFIKKIYSGKNTFQKVPWWEQIDSK